MQPAASYIAIWFETVKEEDKIIDINTEIGSIDSIIQTVYFMDHPLRPAENYSKRIKFTFVSINYYFSCRIEKEEYSQRYTLFLFFSIFWNCSFFFLKDIFWNCFSGFWSLSKVFIYVFRCFRCLSAFKESFKERCDVLSWLQENSWWSEGKGDN